MFFNGYQNVQSWLKKVKGHVQADPNGSWRLLSCTDVEIYTSTLSDVQGSGRVGYNIIEAEHIDYTVGLSLDKCWKHNKHENET